MKALFKCTPVKLKTEVKKKQSFIQEIVVSENFPRANIVDKEMKPW